MQNKTDTQKSVLITGCSSGIGRETALYLAKNGFTVFASVRKEADRQQLCQIGDPNLIPICPLDLTRPADIPPVVETIQAEIQHRGLPGLYALINNAGGGQVAPVELMDLDVFHRELQTRLVGPVALAQAFLPLLRHGGGRILWIMTPSIIPTPYVTSIHACDFAANCIARTLDIELKPWDIPIIQIRCGGIKTASVQKPSSLAETIIRNPRSSLYQEALQKWSEDMTSFDKNRSDPEVVAQVVMTALCAAHPRRRYSIGHMAGTAAFLEWLPQPLMDRIIGRIFAAPRSKKAPI